MFCRLAQVGGSLNKYLHTSTFLPFGLDPLLPSITRCKRERGDAYEF